jgi:hypothetical protein
MTLELSAAEFRRERNPHPAWRAVELGLECHTGCPGAAGEH